MSHGPMTHEEAVALAPLYVLGALEEADLIGVQEHLATCPESHAEFDQLGGVVPYLIEGADLELVEPPPALRDRIMAAAAADLATRRGDAALQPREREPIAFPPAAEREARAAARTGAIGWTMRIAAVIAIVVLGGWNLLLQNDLNAARRFDQAVAAVVDTAAQPGSRAVILAPGDNSQASGLAAVKRDGSVVLAIHGLTPTSGSQVYETWVIPPGSAPVAVGGFTVDSKGIATFTTTPTDAPPGATIAVTREPKAGNTAPEGPIVSAGLANAAST